MKRRILLLCGITAFLFAGVYGCSGQTSLSGDTVIANTDPSGTAGTSAAPSAAAPEAGSDAAAQENTPADGTLSAAENTPADGTAPANDTAAAPQDNAAAPQNNSGLLSETEATEAALKDAGVKESEVTGIRVRLETDDDIQQYEVDFYVGNKEYDYDIKADDGTILSKDMDIDDDFRQNTAAKKPNSSSVISKEEATKIALKEVKGAVASDVRIHLDNDDGRQTYEGSILFNDMEYDFEIDASSGNITEWEAESIYDD